MATLSAGYSFGATEQVTAAKLAALVNNGSVTGITQSDLAASGGLVFVGTSAPSDTDQIWVDTNSSPVILRFYNSNLSAWVPSSGLALYTNRSGQTGAAGRVIILDTTNSNSYTYTSTSGDTKVLGVETGSIANAASAPIITHGNATVLLTVSASAGCYLRTSTATGKADPVVNTASGVFAFLTEAGTASGRAFLFGTDPNGAIDQTSNYTWTGVHQFKGLTTISSTATIASATVLRIDANEIHGKPLVKAWVAGNASAGTIFDSYNVSSLTRNNTGDYTVAFTTAFANANYCAIAIADRTGSGYNGVCVNSGSGASASGCRFISVNGSFAQSDVQFFYAAFFGARSGD